MAGGDGGVGANIADSNIACLLSEGAFPATDDSLVAGEGEGCVPALDGGGAGVPNGHVGNEAVGPLVGDGVVDGATVGGLSRDDDGAIGVARNAVEPELGGRGIATVIGCGKADRD